MKKLFFIAGILTLILVFYAQELQHEVTVTVKLIQVYVTDKEGNPVTDLEKSDFELFDNGKRMVITEFEKHMLFQSLPKEMSQVQETKLPLTRKLNRRFILFFDFAFNSGLGIRRSKKAALHFIDTHLFPFDEVGVISYSPMRGLNLNLDFTTDHQKVRKIVEGFGLREVLGRIKDRRTDEILSRSQDKDLQSLETKIRRYQKRNYINKIRELANALRYVSGQKHIIFFSSGVISPHFYEYEYMLKKLASSSCIVYTVYTEGLAALDREMDLELDRDAYISDREMSEAPKVDRRSTGIPSLERLSEATGGKYFGNVHRYQKIMGDIQNITGSYYVLGYYIDERWDGKYHRIEVRVKRKGYQVRTQQGYFNPKPFAKYSKIEKELHLMGLALARKSFFGEPLEFPLIALPFSDKKGPNVVLLSEIDKEKMNEVIEHKAEIITFIFNRQNMIMDQIRGKFDFLSILQNKAYHYSVASLEPGRYECRVILRNLKTGKAAVASASVVIPVLYSGIHLFPPLLFILEKDTSYLYSKKGQKETKIGALDLKKIYPSISMLSSALINEIDKGVVKLLAEVRCLIIGFERPEIELSSYLLKLPSGEEIPLSFSLISRKEGEGMDTFLLELQLPELEAGEYLLNLIAKEMQTGSVSQASHIFRVK